MTNRDRPSVGDKGGLDRSESSRRVISIRQDFTALVKIFDRQLKLASPSDHETRSHLANAKAAAERGAKLSQQLLELANSEPLEFVRKD